MTLKEDNLKGQKAIKEDNIRVGKQSCRRSETDIWKDSLEW